jgi:carboxyl-terminal processing protease
MGMKAKRWHKLYLAAALLLILTVSLPVPVAAEVDAELRAWARSYEQAIEHALERNWMTRFVPGARMIQDSVEILATRAAEPVPALTGEVRQDTEIARDLLMRVLSVRPREQWGDIFSMAVEGLVARWDPYTRAMSAEEFTTLLHRFGFFDEGSGVFVRSGPEAGRYFISHVAPGMGGEKAGLRLGDEVLSIDGEPLIDINDEMIWRFNRQARRIGHSVFRIRRGELIFEAQVEYRRRSIPRVRHSMVDGAIGFIRIDRFEVHTGYEVEDAVSDLVARGARSIIIDLRDNPGGHTWGAQISLSVFMSGPLYIRRSREGHLLKNETVRALPLPAENVFQGPVAVLVNGFTASASEIMILALRERGARTRIFGQAPSTYGKGTGQTGAELANHWFFFFTVGEAVDLSGRRYDGRGIQVDEIVSARSPGDPLQERAIRWLRELR